MQSEFKNNKKKNIAIVLAGGKGSRMNSDIPKQYMMVKEKPILYYSLKTFEDSFVDEIILVVGTGDIEYCKVNIVDKYNFMKISTIVEGGEERYNSVYNGLQAIGDNVIGNVFIHDGARPCVDSTILKRNLECVEQYGTCVTAMPVKDTIKIVDDNLFAMDTPDRSHLWQIQTPQTFAIAIIKNAYKKFMLDVEKCNITDDAMVVERYGDSGIKLLEGSYSNIKVTTPEDIKIVENIIL